MRRTVRALVVTVVAVVGGVLALPGAASAEGPRREVRPSVGYDVSHPQCATDLPDGQAFGVVGVNGGLATRINPCLVEQLEWAADSTGVVRGQPALQLYVNTANPGQVRDQVDTWPRATDTPYGTCDGGNTMACSWVYGRIRAQVTVHAFFQPAARAAGVDDDPATHRWWLDVETMNTWQRGSSAALERNRAALEGTAAYLQDSGAEVGVYSTGQQWRRIVGPVERDSVLYDLDSWLAGALSRDGALQNCAEPPLTDGGRVVLAQYVEDDLDHDVSCVRDRQRR
ncbi:MAG: hypothetical protein JWR62_2085 [Modestobacter sp.]|jgi:hypothetical protein|nr:hypothetical protein [Modestobacter sp.]